MNCPNCGQPLVGNETQCPRCGIALQPASAQSPWGQPPASTPYPPTGYPSQQGYPPQQQGYPPTGQPGAYPPPDAYPQTPGYPPTGQPPAYPPSGQYPPAGQPPGYPPTGQYPPSQEYPPQQQQLSWTGQPTGQQAPWGGQPTAQPWGLPPTPTPPSSSGGRNVILGIVGAVIVVALIVGGVLFVQHSQTGSTTTSVGANATTTTAATATPSQHIAFQDPLTSNSNGWTDDATNCFFGSGGYHIKGSYICYAPTDDYSDATISVDTKQISGSGTTDYLHGLVFHRTSKGNFYGFEVDANGEWDFFKSVNNSGSEILSPATSSAIKKGLNATNTLKVAIVGTNFTFFINGTQVGTTTDSTFTTGKSGLDGQDGIEVVYSNFLVTTAG